MNVLSVCSGIGAPECAWLPLGFQSVAFSEIEAFPSAVLAERFPGVPNWGDMTKFEEWPDADVDVLVGGTPCQSFSVAGLREGLADPRGNLALTYLAIADRYRPEWLVWENVPGVLSSNGGRDFGAILGAMGKLGYGWAYRVLDAQFYGVAQRRRRVFVVANARDWRRAAAVLFERESLSGHPAPRREAGERTARPIAAGSPGSGGFRNDADTADNLIAFGGNNQSGPIDVATARSAHGGPHGRLDFETETFVVAPPLTHNPYGDHESREGLLVAHSLRGEGFDASEDGTGRGTPLVPAVAAPVMSDGKRAPGSVPDDAASLIVVPFDTKQITSKANRSHPRPGAPSHPLAAGAHPPAIAYRTSGNCGAWETGDRVDTLTTGTDPSSTVLAFSCKDHGADAGETAPTLRAMGYSASHANAGGQLAVACAMSVRRLTVQECERLQGFPDGWTAILYRGKPAADGPRYKALGNSMAVPVMRWIGERIMWVESQQPRSRHR